MRPLSEEGRRILQAAEHAYAPSKNDRARVRRSLAVRVAAGAGAATATTKLGYAAGWLGPLASKGGLLGLVAVVAVGGGVASVGYVRSHRERPGPASISAGAAPVTAVEPRPIPPVSAPRESPTVDEPDEAKQPTSATRSPARRPSARPAPRGPFIERELVLLNGAHQALAQGDAARALALLEEHRRVFPQGGLAEERDAARVIALCKLGRTDDGRRLAARFLEDSPASPLASRVRLACEADE